MYILSPIGRPGGGGGLVAAPRTIIGRPGATVPRMIGERPRVAVPRTIGGRPRASWSQNDRRTSEVSCSQNVRRESWEGRPQLQLQLRKFGCCSESVHGQ